MLYVRMALHSFTSWGRKMKGIKTLLGSSLVVATTLGFSMSAHAISFWHSDTVWANQGMCAANFTFDSGMEPVEQLQVSIVALEKGTDKVKGQTVIEVDEFGTSGADRYAVGYWESELACDENLYLVVTAASAYLDGVKQDLLESGQLNAREFLPYQIRIDR